MAIINMDDIRGVETPEGVFCKDCYEGEYAGEGIRIITEDEIERETGDKLYICDKHNGEL